MIQILLISMLIGCSKKNNYSDVVQKLEARYYKAKGFSYSLPYRLYIPAKYNKSRKYPLVVILHGGGERGNDNISQVGLGVKIFTSKIVQDISKCFVIAPQCPRNSQWVNTKFITTPFDNYKQAEIPESEAMKMVIAVIHSLVQEFSIDEKRLYVLGSSMGASGTWDVISRYPDLFAAAVTMSGVSDPSTAARIAHMPIWAFHGRKDQVSPVYVTQNMIEALRKYKSKCKFTIYNDRGHNIDDLAFNNKQMLEWLFKQRKK